MVETFLKQAKIACLRKFVNLGKDEDGLFEKYLWIESRSRWLI